MLLIYINQYVFKTLCAITIVTTHVKAFYILLYIFCKGNTNKITFIGPSWFFFDTQ